MSKFSDRYRDKVILAPMVRINTLPTRLQALQYGADLVYSDEIIDWRLVRAKRYVNDILGTIDYIDDDFKVVFRTCDLEKDRVVVQIGTADPDRALVAAKKVENDVSGIDVNMGCPKLFSCSGGMGAALLTQPEKVKAILTNLVNNLSIPVTCKIRLLPDMEDTIKLVKLIESTGVAAIGVHGRIKIERPQHKCRINEIKQLTEILTIPVIANGGSTEYIDKYEDIIEFRKLTNASSVMVARTAEHNLSVFRREGLLPTEEVVKEHLRLSIKYDNCHQAVKYIIQSMLGSEQSVTERGKRLLAADQMSTICEIWGLEELYEQMKAEITRKSQSKRKMLDDIKTYADPFANGVTKKSKSDDESGDQRSSMRTLEMAVKYIKSLYQSSNTPKDTLTKYSNKHATDPPRYHTIQVDKHFSSELVFNNVRYKNVYLEKNRKTSEQAVALISCIHLKLIESEKIINESLVTGLPYERVLARTQ